MSDGSIIGPRSWTRQPQTYARVDWSNPVNNALCGWWTVNAGGFRNLAADGLNTTPTAVTRAYAGDAVAASFNGSSSKVTAPLSAPMPGGANAPFAFETLVRLNSLPGFYSLCYFTGSIEIYGTSTGNLSITSSSFQVVAGVTTGLHHIVYSRDASSSYFMLDGVTFSGTYYNAAIATSSVILGAYNGASEWLNGDIVYSRLLNRYMPEQEARARRARPWEGLNASPRRTYFGVTAGGGVSGALTKTEAADTVASAGTVPVVGTLGVTEAADTVVSTGTVPVAGTLGVTEAADTVVSMGTVPVVGTLGVTEAADTIGSTGVVGSIPVEGTLTKTEAADTVASAGNVPVNGSLTKTEAADTVASTGTVPVVGTLTKTEAADTVASIGTVPVNGSLTKAEAGDTVVAAGTVVTLAGVNGALTKTEAADTVAATGETGVFRAGNGNVFYLKPRKTVVHFAPRPTTWYLRKAA